MMLSMYRSCAGAVGLASWVCVACTSAPAADGSGGGAPEGSGGQVAEASGGAATGGAAGSGDGADGGSGGLGSGGIPGSGGAVVAGTGGSAVGSGGTVGSDTPGVFVFARTVEYRHEAIEAGVGALQGLADERGWDLAASEDPALFEDAALAPFHVIVFLLTTGDVLDAEQEAAFERFIQSGKGYVGVHSASDTEYDWPWYGELVGAYFAGHGAVQSATVLVEDGAHPATEGVPSPWVRTDEWYGFQSNPRGEVNVLLTLDESTFEPGEGAMGEDHPIAWYREFDGGRSFYTALGHTLESYTEPEFLGHLAGGVEWAAGATAAP